MQVTPAQQHYLRLLKVKPADMKGLNKVTASNLITEKLAEKDTEPATPAQIKLLQTLEYKGPTPRTRSLASRMIDDVRRARRISFLKRKAMRKGIDLDTVRRLEQYVLEHNL